MSPKNTTPIQDDEPPHQPQVPPPGVGYGHPEYHFVQGLMEIQKQLGILDGSIKQLDQSLQGVKSKVDDLVKWKNMILGGAIVLGVVISGAAWFFSKASDYFTITAKSVETQQVVPQVIEQPAPPVPEIKPRKK